MKKYIGQWSAFELIWLGIFCSIAIVITIASKDTLFGFLIFLSGVFCVVFAAKGNILTYPIGIFNTLGYAWLSWRNGLYGEVGLYMGFFLPTSIIGWYLWRSHSQHLIVAMRKLTWSSVFLLAIMSAIAALILGYSLSFIATQNTPYIDAATTVLSITATLLMMLRYREQWLAYIILNILAVIMWIYRLIHGSQDGMMMIVMWSAFLINAVYGFYNWTKGVKIAEQAG